MHLCILKKEIEISNSFSKRLQYVVCINMRYYLLFSCYVITKETWRRMVDKENKQQRFNTWAEATIQAQYQSKWRGLVHGSILHKSYVIHCTYCTKTR